MKLSYFYQIGKTRYWGSITLFLSSSDFSPL